MVRDGPMTATPIPTPIEIHEVPTAPPTVTRVTPLAPRVISRPVQLSPRPITGEVLFGEQYLGARHCGLEIINSTPEDALLILATTGTKSKILAFYVRDGDTFKLTCVPAGTYDNYVRKGHGWLGPKMRFFEPTFFGMFADPITFAETQRDGTVEYQENSLTLHSVPGGNIHLKRLDDEDRPGGE